MRFVVQEHEARSHHFDFRLEHAGMFASWAVPKGMPMSPGESRLAIKVADHELSFGDFEGELAEGSYGAGSISLWDNGSYSPLQWSADEIRVRLDGCRLRWTYKPKLFTSFASVAAILACFAV